MGGKLFNLPRMPRGEYLAREAEVRAYLDRTLAGQYRVPRYYADKPDFGDMDVIVASRPEWGTLREQIVRELGITEVKPTGHVYSTVYRGLQTDFFTVPAAYLDSTYNFMSFNDLGNFIGKIARRFDLKYGGQGLSYVFRRGRGAGGGREADGGSGGHYKADLEITQDFARICAFLGLDYPAWERGFGSLTELFDWVVASPYFSVAPYLDEPTAGGDAMKARLQDRTTVVRMVAYLRERGIDKRPVLEPREAHVPRVHAAFPEADLPGQLARERALEARAAVASERFNGKRVMGLLPQLQGRALGEFIVAFKRSVPDFAAYVQATPGEQIDAAILAFAREYPPAG